MADEADIANAYITRAIETALGQRQQTGATKMGLEFCKECGDAIPTERRKLGFQLCVTCASENERRKSQFADY
jgi:phage/conjugal plasmid C-4 type zinc finger TraR family protein